MISRNSIVERLLEQGHIVIVCADRILNKKGEYLQDIEDLHRDGPISTSEAVLLLSEDTSESINPYIQQPMYVPPIQWDQDQTGSPPPIYCQTTTLD
tara:strand:- start:2137 stop:2427 length:291 start_codon:yes stop_codon:yes gene_type:complete